MICYRPWYITSHTIGNKLNFLALYTARQYSEITLDQFFIYSSSLGVPAKLAQRWMRPYLENIERLADKIITEVEQMLIPTEASRFRPGMLHLLREIRYRVIAENIRRFERVINLK